MATVFEEVCAALNRSGVRYVVVGGVAVVLHGYPRLTADLDLVVDLAPEQAAAAIDAIVGLGYRPRLPVDPGDFADPDVRRGWVEERNLRVFSLHDPGDPVADVDVFAEHPIPFDELWADSVVLTVGGTDIPVASIDHLVRLKEEAGRPQDELDIEALRRIRRERDG